ncbi:hypothetical protein V7S43_016868 [Phytophthora oleae]|uniref:Uncharacterized protein n=1 Tax=Phytophthora oleae TaxID=2107226 RepID=A0ABD3EYU8_9STRA
MVRVPGSSADSGYHRESIHKDVKTKVEPGIGASTEDDSPSSHLKSEGYTPIASVLGGTLSGNRRKVQR